MMTSDYIKRTYKVFSSHVGAILGAKGSQIEKKINAPYPHQLDGEPALKPLMLGFKCVYGRSRDFILQAIAYWYN